MNSNPVSESPLAGIEKDVVRIAELLARSHHLNAIGMPPELTLASSRAILHCYEKNVMFGRDALKKGLEPLLRDWVMTQSLQPAIDAENSQIWAEVSALADHVREVSRQGAVDIAGAITGLADSGRSPAVAAHREQIAGIFAFPFMD